MKLKINCGPCRAPGLYCGFAEPKGTAVVCHGCGGKGYIEKDERDVTPREREEKLFTVRKPKPGVKRVLGDGGLWMCRTGNERTISIEEFYNLT